MRLHLLMVPLLGLTLGLGACTDQPAPPQSLMANPNPPVPPPRAETIPKPPPSEELLVRQPGEWEWVGNGYVWQPGEWVKLSGHSNQFLPGHWSPVNGVWTWERGHWL
jgi:hypothetical protein